MGENEDLRDHMKQIEKDTIDVVSFLKKQDLEKDAEVDYFQSFQTKTLLNCFNLFFRLLE